VGSRPSKRCHASPAVSSPRIRIERSAVVAELALEAVGAVEQRVDFTRQVEAKVAAVRSEFNPTASTGPSRGSSRSPWRSTGPSSPWPNRSGYSAGSRNAAGGSATSRPRKLDNRRR
jgi:hypothetical protein